VFAQDVIEVVDRLDAAGVWYCVEGGWGVDALLGEQTREHDDVDLGVRMDEVERICAALHEFRRRNDEWPASFVLRDSRGRQVDAHPLEFDGNGDGWQASLCGAPSRWPREHLNARGWIAGRQIRCITPELQLRWHRHDGFDDVDWADMRALCERFGLRPRPPFGPRPGFVAAKRVRADGG
jgi:lincosamide nucleotidyltransferase A/C/D/E